MLLHIRRSTEIERRGDVPLNVLNQKRKAPCRLLRPICKVPFSGYCYPFSVYMIIAASGEKINSFCKKTKFFYGGSIIDK